MGSKLQVSSYMVQGTRLKAQDTSFQKKKSLEY
jgi:hypothetical protein